MTVGELLGGAYRTLVRRRKELLIWTAIQLVIGAILFSAMMPFMSSVLEARQYADPTVPQPLPEGFGLFMLVYLLLIVWLLVLFCAVIRMTASAGEDRFLWLRLGMDEVRLIGLAILYLIVSMIVWVIVALVVSLIVGLAAWAAGVVGGLIVGSLLAILCICGAIWLAVRISLIAPVTVLDRAFAIRKGWRATRGNFWTLFLTYLVMIVGYFILEILLLAILSPALLGSMFAPGDPERAIEAQQQMIATLATPSVGLIVMWVVGAFIGTVAMAYYYAVTAHAAIAATGYSTQDLAELEGHFE